MTEQSATNGKLNGKAQSQHDQYSGFTDPDYFLAHILTYLECPPHLRKNLFPVHPNLRLAGSLPSLDMPHHLRKTEWCKYREGVTVTRADRQDANTTPVQTGLKRPVNVRGDIPEDSRVTIKFESNSSSSKNEAESLLAEVVAPSAPRDEAGYYWGYSVRSASSLTAVLTECPFDGGYDLTFGTSERGTPLSNIVSNSASTGIEIPSFSHMLVVFGGVAGLEAAFKADEELQGMNLTGPEDLFDFWINALPGQGSRTIRTEEALWVVLTGLRGVVLEKGIE